MKKGEEKEKENENKNKKRTWKASKVYNIGDNKGIIVC
jgi:hypothetical protein